MPIERRQQGSRAAALSVAVAALMITGAAGQPAGQPPPREWRDYAGGLDSYRFVAAASINKSNVGRLEVAWAYPAGDTDFNPVVARGVIFTRANGDALVAVDAATGKQIWLHGGIEGFALRGVNYWESKDGADRRLFFTARNMLYALDARTGAAIPSF